MGSIEEILKDISKIIARLISIILLEDPKPLPQLGQSSVSPRIKPEASEIDFDELGVKEIYDRIRMLDGLDYPPAYIVMGRYKIFLSEATLQGNELKFVSRLEEKK
jgi:methionyl-tRNA formyltransferase